MSDNEQIHDEEEQIHDEEEEPLRDDEDEPISGDFWANFGAATLVSTTTRPKLNYETDWTLPLKPLSGAFRQQEI